MTPGHWLPFLAAFLIVIALLTIAACIQEWLQWRRQRRRGDRR